MDEHEQYNLDNPDSSSQTPQEDFSSSDNIIKTNKDFSIKDSFLFNEKEAVNRKGQKFNRTMVSGANYTAAAQDFLLAITSLAVAPSIGLPKPSLAGAGKHFIIKDEVGGAATTTITIKSDGEANIDGSSSATLINNYAEKEFYTDGKNWFTSRSYIPVSSAFTLLKAGSGTSVSTSAVNLDTIALSGLTALDVIKIVYTFSTLTQNSNAPQIYSNTDSQDIIKLNNGNALGNPQTISGEIILQQAQEGATILNAVDIGAAPQISGGNTIAFGGIVNGQSNTMATAWTSPWTLALRSQGVTAGGTLRYSWKVYKLSGQ